MGVVGFLTLMEYVLGISAGIDELLFRDPPGSGSSPGRMATTTAASFATLGAALAVAGAGSRRAT